MTCLEEIGSKPRSEIEADELLPLKRGVQLRAVLWYATNE